MQIPDLMLCLHMSEHLPQAAARIAAQMEQLRDFDVTIEQLRLAAVGGAAPTTCRPAWAHACMPTGSCSLSTAFASDHWAVLLLKSCGAFA